MANPSLTSMVYAMGKFFKSMPSDRLEDLKPADRELWPRGKAMPGTAEKLPGSDAGRGTDYWSDTGEQRVDPSRDEIGSPESASGGGAEDMSGRYSADTQPGDRLTQLATQMGDALTEQREMIRGLYKALNMVADQMTVIAGSSKFPASESGGADDDDDEKKKNDDEDDELEKSAAEGRVVLNSNLKGLFDKIAGVTRSGRSDPRAKSGKVPNFHTLVKGRGLEDILSELDEAGATSCEMIQAESQWQRAYLVSQGKIDASFLTRPEAMRSARVNELFMLTDPRIGHPSR